MGKLEFNSNVEPTLGIELELGLVDENTIIETTSAVSRVSFLIGKS